MEGREGLALSILIKHQARPMRSWKSVVYYETLVGHGFAKELHEDNPFFRRFEITDLGREEYAAQQRLKRVG